MVEKEDDNGDAEEHEEIGSADDIFDGLESMNSDA